MATTANLTFKPWEGFICTEDEEGMILGISAATVPTGQLLIVTPGRTNPLPGNSAMSVAQSGTTESAVKE